MWRRSVVSSLRAVHAQLSGTHRFQLDMSRDMFRTFFRTSSDVAVFVDTDMVKMPEARKADFMSMTLLDLLCGRQTGASTTLAIAC